MARCQLINSVLLSLHVYWAQVFFLPQRTLNDVIKACRAFLLSGQYFSSKPGSIAWEHICIKKEAGGLGFRDMKL